MPLLIFFFATLPGLGADGMLKRFFRTTAPLLLAPSLATVGHALAAAPKHSGQRLVGVQRRAMSAAAESSRERELEQLPKSELVRRLLAAEQAQQQPAATHESASTSISGDTTGAVASRGVKRSTPDGGGGGRGTRGKKGKAAKKKKKAFDMSRCRQRHVALKVAYYGQRYHGFAAQDDNDNTIEAHLFHALQRTCLIKDRDSANYSRCGRTDKGVSALGQVVGLYLRSKHTDDANPALLSREAVAAAAAPKAPRPPPKPAAGGSGADSGGESEDEGDAPGYTLAQAARNEVVRDPSDWATPEPESELNYIKMLNGVLPPEIRVLGWAHVPPSSLFSARFSCKQRVYHYYFPKGALDTAAMAEAASSFVGEHDFRNFCKMDVANVTHFMRRITAFTVETVDSTGGPGGPFGMCYLRIEGTAFLWHQVRCMAAVLFMVGNRLEEPSIVADLLDIEKHPRKPQ